LLKLLAVTRCTGMKYLLQKGHAWKHKIWFVEIMKHLTESLELCHRKSEKPKA
jgi:hypothetical protein